MIDPFSELRRSLGHNQEETGEVGGFAHVDLTREQRKGAPEVVLAAGKQPDQIVQICRLLLRDRGRVVISRVDDVALAAITDAFAAAFAIDQRSGGRLLVVRRHDYARPETGGRLGVITAGTSDLPYADEAATIAEEMGCSVRLIADVGVAGLHRLFPPLTELLSWDPDVIIVAAGMDGALASVVSGLVPTPVIGLPTPIGYGLGGEGIGALTTMLQSCAPGLAVVNIGNGVGAGATAALIANRAARGRRAVRSTMGR